jgi:clan AA aspartic protease (TIGR02281 family)
MVLLFGVYIVYMMNKKTNREDQPSDQAISKAEVIKHLPEGSKKNPLKTGGILLKDLEGREISSWASAVISDRWVAAPVWSLLQGKSLVFEAAAPKKIAVKTAFWTKGDPIILVQIPGDPLGITQQLFPWKQYKPLEWQPYFDNESFRIDIPTPEKRGSFLSFRLPTEIQEAGVFMQEGDIVGWAYPEWMDKGYLWGGPAGHDLTPNIQIEEFFQTNLANWRETRFENILIRGGNISTVRKLETLAEVLGINSRFAAEDVPQKLSSQSVVEHMHSLASELMKNGLEAEVARILDDSIIVESGDLSLLKNSVLARVESEDHNRAIQFLEKTKKDSYDTKGQSIPGLDQFHAELYKDWLRKILDQGSYYSGMMAFEQAKRHFPDDIEIHLLGVEMALEEKNWTRARELLQMRDYPENMRGWVGELENEIQEVQETEGAITIRFNPGSRHIPVRVYLNGSHPFQFILDTGATLCSIPSSAVERLRISIDNTTPVRLISTAGGIAETYEVKLKTVELEGFRISNVEALIIDIPGYRDYGLLGQNFLNNFHIEIDNQKGILRLKKR